MMGASLLPGDAAGPVTVHLVRLGGAPPVVTGPAAARPVTARDPALQRHLRRRQRAEKRDAADDGSDDPALEEDDEPEDMAGVTGRARARERRRIAAIFAAAAGLDRVGARELAAHFAFETSLPRGQAIAALRAATEDMPTPTMAARSRLLRRGTEPEPPARRGLAERVITAMQRAREEGAR